MTVRSVIRSHTLRDSKFWPQEKLQGDLLAFSGGGKLRLRVGREARQPPSIYTLYSSITDDGVLQNLTGYAGGRNAVGRAEEDSHISLFDETDIIYGRRSGQ